MSEKEKKILETFEKIIPNLSEVGKEKLISFGEGMAFARNNQKKECDYQEKNEKKAIISNVLILNQKS